MKRQLTFIIDSILTITMFMFFSCTKSETNIETNGQITHMPESNDSGTDSTVVVCVDFGHVMGTDIPAAELRQNRVISAEEFLSFTEGKYYMQSGYYCQWKGDTLQYLQTGENHYSLRGLHDFIGFFGIWYTQFEDSIIHFYNDIYLLDYRFVCTYNDSTSILTIPNFKYGRCEKMDCKIVYIDDKYIVVETAPFQATMSSDMAHLIAIKAQFVQLLFTAVDPPEHFIGFTDWEVYNCYYFEDAPKDE